ncbi:Serine/threonine protein kinase [Catalinimonas alkaloidigena]|uniref:Serine/threonine protein kinase n=1 Tax=Catalinimonas alkaloidigena TaxID=1075417 RepID=A0A1G9DSQ4_9BACT|nr:serine/threonine-protein kinase [Catalinimonas alkaloidigena]SDK66864.1 Serine/threonine protein kinase [Catalinimonas alkaloidigena]
MIAPGEQLVNYRIDAHVGDTPLGGLYEAEHVRSERKVLIRHLDTHLIPKPALWQAFKNDLMQHVRLQHPNLVALLDHLEDERGIFLVTEQVKGVPLETYLQQQGPLSEAQIRRLFLQLLDALSHAHYHEVVHGDLRPAHLWITPQGNLRLSNLGLTPLLNELLPDLSDTEAHFETIVYMSPERVTGEPITPASDIYAAGVLLYRLVAGHAPYQYGQQSEYEVFRRIVNEPLPPLPDGANLLFAKAIEHATQKSPTARFQSAAQFRQALSPQQAPAAAPPRPATPPPAEAITDTPVQLPRERVISQGILLVSLLGLVLIGSLFFVMRSYTPDLRMEAGDQVGRLFEGLNQHDPKILRTVFAPELERYYQFDNYPLDKVINNYQNYWKSLAYDRYQIREEQVRLTQQNDGSFDANVPVLYERAYPREVRLFNYDSARYEQVTFPDEEAKNITFRIRLNSDFKIIYFREQSNDNLAQHAEALLARTWKLARYSENGLQGREMGMIRRLTVQLQRLIRRNQLELSPEGNFTGTYLFGEDEAGTWQYEPRSREVHFKTADQDFTFQLVAISQDRMVLKHKEKQKEEFFVYRFVSD